MTRETKIGLVVGIGFIVCFAVILSHGGKRDGMKLQQADNFVSVDGDRPIEVASREGHLPAHVLPKKAKPTRRRNPTEKSRRVESPTEWRTDDVRLAAGEVSSGRRSGVSSGEPAAALSSLAEQRRVAKGEAAKPSPPPNRRERRSSIAATPPPVENTALPPREPAPKSAERRAQPEAVRVITLYTVQSSDSLSSIAQKFYGSQSAKAIKAIYEANTDVLKDMDHIRAGESLRIPQWEGSPAAEAVVVGDIGGGQRESKPAEDAASGEVKSEGEWHWYTVQPLDLYTTISQKELGTARRWRELFELNKDIFSDPDQIRSGVRIRIPSGGVDGGVSGR